MNYTVIVGLAEDEASEAILSEAEIAEGMGPATKDKYFRTLVRNTCTKSVVSFGQILQVPTLELSFQIRNSYDYHLNEIFATVQNEYSDLSSDNGAIIRELVLAYTFYHHGN